MKLVDNLTQSWERIVVFSELLVILLIIARAQDLQYLYAMKIHGILYHAWIQDPTCSGLRYEKKVYIKHNLSELSEISN